MSDVGTTGGFLSGGRPSFFRYVVRLYAGDNLFRGLADFAAIGAVVLLFLHPPSMNWFHTPAAERPATSPVAQAPGLASTQSSSMMPARVSPPGPAAAPLAAAPASVPTPAAVPAPAPQSPARISANIPIPPVDEVRRPRLMFRFLIEIDQAPFRDSAPEDRAHLLKATQAHRALHYQELPDFLAGASSSDPNVAFLRGLAAIYQGDSQHYTRAAAQLRAAQAGGQLQAGAVLGTLLVSGPQGVDKDIEQGRRIIEESAAKGDRTALRAAGIGYLGGEFGVLDPFKAADYLKRGVAAGDLPSMMHYAYLLATGAGVEKDEVAAEELLESTAKGGLTGAQEMLGYWILARYKAGVISDPSEGVRWLEQAYLQGFSISALQRLAVFYADDGRGPPWKDRSKADDMFSLGAQFSYFPTLVGYATDLHFGYGVEKDLVKAYTYYEVGRQLGSTAATARLKTLDDLLTGAEKTTAMDAVIPLRRQLKPVPGVIVLQYPERRPLYVPWPSAAPAGSRP